MLFILKSRILVYYAWSGVQVVLSGFSLRLLWFVHAKNVMYVRLYVLLAAIACKLYRLEPGGPHLSWHHTSSAKTQT